MALKNKSNSLNSFLFVVCLLIAAIIATYISVNGGEGQMLGATTTKTSGSGVSKLTGNVKSCGQLDQKCCPDKTGANTICLSKLDNIYCDFSDGEWCRINAQKDYGQGTKACAVAYPGARCDHTSTCGWNGGTSKPGYCPGPSTWQCCVPKKSGAPTTAALKPTPKIIKPTLTTIKKPTPTTIKKPTPTTIKKPAKKLYYRKLF